MVLVWLYHSSSITIHRTKVPLSINERISKWKILSHTNHSLIYRAITVWMVLTEYIPDYSSRLSILCAWSKSLFMHRVEDTSMYWLKTISHIRKCSWYDNTHRILHVTALHLIRNTSICISLIYRTCRNR